MASSVGEEWVVGEDGADSGEDCVGLMAELLDGGAGFFAGDPEGLAGGSGFGRRGDAAVEGHRDLHQDEGALVLDPFGEAFVEAAGFGFTDARGDLNAGCGECLHPMAGYVGIGVGGGGDYARDSGGDEGLGAGAGAAGVVAGLEGDVGGGAFEPSGLVASHPFGKRPRMDGAPSFIRQTRSVFEGGDFGVVEAVVFMPAFSDEFTVRIDNDAAYGRVRGCEADAPTGEGEGVVHPVGVLGGGHELIGRVEIEINAADTKHRS